MDFLRPYLIVFVGAGLGGMVRILARAATDKSLMKNHGVISARLVDKTGFSNLFED